MGKNCILSFVPFQKDFMELGERLKKCTDPSIFPKTVVFCRQKEMVAKVFQFLQHSAKSKDFVGMYHANLSEQRMKCTDDFATLRRYCAVLLQQLLLAW